MTFVEFLLKNPTAPIILVSAGVAFASWRSQRQLTRAKHAIDLQNNYLSSERILVDIYKVAELSRQLNATEIERLSCVDVTTANKKDRRQLASLRTVLNALERMAIGIRRDVYDTELLYSSYATYVIETWTAFLPYIKAKQATNPRYYKNLDWLALEWQTKRDRFNKNPSRG